MTRKDVEEIKGHFDGVATGLREELKQHVANQVGGLREEMGGLRTELRAEFRSEMGGLREEMGGLRDRERGARMSCGRTWASSGLGARGDGRAPG